MRNQSAAFPSIAGLGMICLILLASSCGRGGIGGGAETIYVTNKMDKEIFCVLRIDGSEVPTGVFGPKGTSTATLPRHYGKKNAHFNLVDTTHIQSDTEIDIDLTKIPGWGDDLHFDIMSMTEVKVFYANRGD